MRNFCKYNVSYKFNLVLKQSTSLKTNKTNATRGINKLCLTLKINKNLVNRQK